MSSPAIGAHAEAKRQIRQHIPTASIFSSVARGPSAQRDWMIRKKFAASSLRFPIYGGLLITDCSVIFCTWGRSVGHLVSFERLPVRKLYSGLTETPLASMLDCIHLGRYRYLRSS